MQMLGKSLFLPMLLFSLSCNFPTYFVLELLIPTGDIILMFFIMVKFTLTHTPITLVDQSDLVAKFTRRIFQR